MALSRRSAIKAPEPARTLTPEGQVRWDLIVAGVAVAVIIIDQITKALIHARFSGNRVYDVVPVIGNIITFVFDKNPGAAFSSFTNSPLLLGLLITIAVGVIAYMYWTNRPRDYPLLKLTFGMIAGGAVGNLIDRVRYGYVTDFVHFQLPSLHFDFAIFNVADSAISIGVVLLAFVFWTLPREAVPDPGADAPTDAGAALPLAKTSAVTKTGATGKPAMTSTTRTPTNPIKSGTGATTNGATSKTPTSPVKGAAGTPRATTATAATTSPTRGAPVATATRAGSGNKSKGKRRS